MKRKFNKKNREESSNKKQSGNSAEQCYYLMDEMMNCMPLDNLSNQMMTHIVNRTSHQFPFPNGEVIKCRASKSTWWISSAPLSLLAAVKGNKEPLVTTQQFKHILGVYYQDKLVIKIDLSKHGKINWYSSE